MLFFLGFLAAILPSVTSAHASSGCVGELTPVFLADYVSPDPDLNVVARFPGSVLPPGVRHRLILENEDAILALPGPVLAGSHPVWGPLERLRKTAPRDRRFRDVRFLWTGLRSVLPASTESLSDPPFAHSAFLLLPPLERIRAIDIARPSLEATYGADVFPQIRAGWLADSRPRLDAQTFEIVRRVAATVRSGDTAEILNRIDEVALIYAEPIP